MFERLFIEKHLLSHPRAQKILGHFQHLQPELIGKVDDLWGQVKRPYLQKRQGLRLFLGEKHGEAVKKAPMAYGLDNGPHYYFIHAYNCIYECEYCYLQGHFHTPDIVLFLNHEDIGERMREVANQERPLLKPDQAVWFHAGEFSDSLALAHLTGEWDYYFNLMDSLPWAKLELRTKSANIRPLMHLGPRKNVIISYSLTPASVSVLYDRKTPGLMARLKCLKELAKEGHPLGLHLDPIIYQEDFEQVYLEFLDQLLEHVPESSIAYISLGVVRFTEDVYAQVQKNYPGSLMLSGPLMKSFDQKIRYPYPLRMRLLKGIKKALQERGVGPHKIYLCMEKDTPSE